MYTYYNFFIHSSVDGHLGCFHLLAIVNSAAMNNGIHVFFSVLVSSGYMPRSGIAGLYGGFNHRFLKESPYHLPRWLYQYTFPPTVQECSLFSTPSPAFIVCRLFDVGYSDRCEVISHCSFDLHLSNNEQCWASFHVFVSHLCLWRDVYLGLFPTFWLGCLFLWYWVVWATCIVWKLILCRLFHLLLFSLILRVVFSPCLQFPLLCKSFWFNQVPLDYFCFYFCYSWRWVIEDIALIYVIKCSAYVFL